MLHLGKPEVCKICVDFESPLVLGTQYGAPAGHHSGDVIFTSNAVKVSVHDFNYVGGGGTFNVARVETSPVAFGSGQSIRTNNINLGFHFTGIGVYTTPVQGGNKGIVILTGVAKDLKVGGQEFWLDNVCARQ